MIKSSRIYNLIVVTVLLFGFPAVVNAESQSGLTLSPPSSSANATPGEVINSSFLLENRSEEDLFIELTTQEFIVQDGSLILNEEESISADWIKLAVDSIALSPGANTTFDYEITIPSDTISGAYFPAIMIEYGSDSSEQQTSGTNINPRFAYRIDLNVNASPPITSVQVTGINVPRFVVIGEPTITYTIENPTKGFISPIAHLQVLSPLGQQIYRDTINDNLAKVEPGGSITGEFKIEIDYADTDSIGIYRVELLAIDQQFGNSDILKAEFYVIPLWLILLVVLILLVIILLFTLVVNLRRRGKRK